MKKILLFLLLITITTHADIITEIEQAIIKSDLPAIEQLLGHHISLLPTDQMALINLATEMIRKRENKIELNEFELVAPHNRHNIKYIKNNDKLTSLAIKSLVCFLSSTATFLIGGFSFALFSDAANTTTARTFLIGNSSFTLSNKVSGTATTASTAIGCAAFAISGLSFIGCLVFLAKHRIMQDEIIEKKKARYNDRYNAAIKIRQCLYRINC
jgi:hypothetical protein